ncbi:MAG: phenylalanine--tRNA ligase subunit alpha [Bdellovibrionales bacterium]
MLEKLKEEILSAIATANDTAALENVRVDALGKKGKITELLKALGGMDEGARKTQGALINQLKEHIANALDERKTQLSRAEMDARLEAERTDITLNAAPEPTGSIHPISQTIEELVEIFGSMGFTLSEGPDIEDDEHNFTALNIPQDHPARQMQDTFYLPETADKKMVLRTQTSPIQIRHMRSGKPPFRTIGIGRCYRVENDATHVPMFHQIEGLVIDRDITMAHLRGCLMDFLAAFFGTPVKTRFRPSYFPFTEPSAEVDVGCNRQGGELKIGEGNDWMEILGCGMVHPNVLKNCGLDPDEWQGFAFGCGVDRLAMLKYGIPDLRPMFESDTRWLQHYGFSPLQVPSLARGTL